MEQLEIHSKSYLVRWVGVQDGNTISWNIRPDRHSIRFGLFKHPGDTDTPKLPSSTFEPPPTPGLKPLNTSQDTTRNASSNAAEKLKSIGLKSVEEFKSCEANRVFSGTYDVGQNQGGMYALVFDNTFSKQISKTATFVLLIYPSDTPPQSKNHAHHIQGSSTEGLRCSKGTLEPKAQLAQKQHADSVPHSSPLTDGPYGEFERSKVDQQGDGQISRNPNSFSGVLLKRRRKRGQGYARRFFFLDYNSATLSYYHNRNSLALRGAVPLSLAAVGANAKTRHLTIDGAGAELWFLKATDQKDFDAWKHALEHARTNLSSTLPASALKLSAQGVSLSTASMSSDDERQWDKVAMMVDRVMGSRDAARNLAIETDPKYSSISPLKTPSHDNLEPKPTSTPSSTSDGPSDQNSNGYFNDGRAERRPFWKRKPSRPAMPGMYRSVSATPTTSQPNLATVPVNKKSREPLQSHSEEGLHDRCMALLQDLDVIVSDFGFLISESKQLRASAIPSAVSRRSIDSQGSDEFFDAEGGNAPQLLAIHDETDEEGHTIRLSSSGDEDWASASDVEEANITSTQKIDSDTAHPAFPAKPDSLIPLPVQRINGRTKVPPPAAPPPHLLSILRNNMGKDLTTISMPVSTNEPMSLLQRLAELLEYSTLLNRAALPAITSVERLIHVTAFAISALSSTRVKERAIRKPFNPMLGETFEFVGSDFRFVAEKVSHRPVRMACHVDNEKWSLSQSPLPISRFYGKSCELVTEGKIRISLHSTGDRFSFSPPTSFLRNIIAGEKYVEPTGSTTITNESTGEKAVISFKSKGMFSGRSEDVVAQTFDGSGNELPLGLVGKWTSSLSLTEHGSPRASEPPIWSVADLIPDAAKRYGFTTFAASLNEVSPIEEEKLPPTDSRLRPDQRAAENGDLDQAEMLKTKLEEAQRRRRKVMEEEGKEWQPKWFEKLEGADDDGEEVWVAKKGGANYWEARKRGNWKGVERVFDD